MIKVITYGTYDMLHYGHVRLLERAKALGDYLIVGVTSDAYDKSRGKINNQQSLMERIEAVKSTGLVDEIIVEEYDGQKIDDIKRYGIDIFTVGSDWEGKFDYLNEFCKVIYLPRTEGISSSEIRSKQRKIELGIIGNSKIAEKFKKECNYVNGVDCVGIITINEIDNVDAIYIASRPIDHYETIKKLLSNKKHVLCESPITLANGEYAELYKIAQKNECILMDGIKTAYSTAYNRLLVLAKSGKIGNIVSVDATCTSMEELNSNLYNENSWNSICSWGPTALLPIFQLLGTKWKDIKIVSKIMNDNKEFDAFTKADFIYDNAVASIKVAKAAKSEGELIITGTKGYIYVPAPWWKTDYFEVRYENQTDNKRYFYQLDGEGIRYEIVAFAKAIESKKESSYISTEESKAICKVMEDYYLGNNLIIIN